MAENSLLDGTDNVELRNHIVVLQSVMAELIVRHGLKDEFMNYLEEEKTRPTLTPRTPDDKPSTTNAQEAFTHFQGVLERKQRNPG